MTFIKYPSSATSKTWNPLKDAAAILGVACGIGVSMPIIGVGLYLMRASEVFVMLGLSFVGLCVMLATAYLLKTNTRSHYANWIADSFHFFVLFFLTSLLAVPCVLLVFGAFLRPFITGRFFRNHSSHDRHE